MMAPKTRSFHLLCFSFTSVLLVAAIFLQIFILSVSVSLLFRRVEEVVRYPGLPPRRQLTYQAKQTISREMEQEKMRRAEQLMLQRNPVAVRCPACSAVRQCCVCSSSNVSRRVCVCVAETGGEKERWSPTPHQEPSAEAGEHCQTDHSGGTGEIPAHVLIAPEQVEKSEPSYVVWCSVHQSLNV